LIFLEKSDARSAPMIPDVFECGIGMDVSNNLTSLIY
jgi:hypothetical protein